MSGKPTADASSATTTAVTPTSAPDKPSCWSCMKSTVVEGAAIASPVLQGAIAVAESIGVAATTTAIQNSNLTPQGKAALSALVATGFRDVSTIASSTVSTAASLAGPLSESEQKIQAGLETGLALSAVLVTDKTAAGILGDISMTSNAVLASAPPKTHAAFAILARGLDPAHPGFTNDHALDILSDPTALDIATAGVSLAGASGDHIDAHA